MNDDAELAVAEAALAEAIAQMPADQRAALPTDEGEPYVEIVQALYRYERPRPGEIRWIEVRELSAEEWDAVIAAHREVYRSLADWTASRRSRGATFGTRATSCCGSCGSRPGPMSGLGHSSNTGSSTTALR